MTRRPSIPDRRVALLAGLLLVGAGWYCLYDAYDARGAKKPMVMRPFVWW
jgi:hypothetical protein